MNTYENIKKELKSQKALIALENVKNTIDYFEKQKLEYNISSIGRYCIDTWGSPKTQSIRNNKSLVSYIEYRKNIFKKQTLKIEDKSTNETIILDNIEDEKIKQHIQIEREKYKILENKYNNLKKMVTTLQPIDIDNLIENNLNIDKPQDLQEIKKLETVISVSNIGDFDINNLIEVLNNKYLKHLDIQLGYKNGVIFNVNTGDLVYKSNNN